LDTDAKNAMLHIWQSRAEASERKKAAGKTDTGKRGEATSGAHLDEVAKLIAQVFIDAKIPPECVHIGRSKMEVPGYYRATKQWDVLVVQDGKLIAAVELKMIDSSYGNNLNNRTEEALGNAYDLAQAVKNDLCGKTAPWLGWVFVMNDEPKSRKAVKVNDPHFCIDPIFKDSSYQERARILCRRLELERVYSKAWFVAGNKDGVTEPDNEMSWAKFKAAIQGKVGEVLA